MANRASRTPKTWSLLGDVRRKPSTYEVTAASFHYHFRREPAPFELDPGMPLNRWYLEYREGSPFQVDDWEGFRDPHKLTYKDYVPLQHDRETYLDLLIDTHEAAGSRDAPGSGLGGHAAGALRAAAVPAARPADDRPVRRADGAVVLHHQRRQLRRRGRNAARAAHRVLDEGAG